MRVTCVVQARMGSTRLPGKVLADLGGRPALQLLLERLEPATVDAVVVATSTSGGDDPVADLAASLGVAVVRGSEVDVLGRFAAALDAFPADEVVRLTADCPLVDPVLVGAALQLRRATGADYASNTLVRTFPDGLDVEALTADALREAAAEADDPAEREHVTPFLYRRPERYRLVALRGPEPLGDERWTLDTPDDLARLRAIVACLPDPRAAGWREVLASAGIRRPPDPSGWLRPVGEADIGPLRALDGGAGTVAVGDLDGAGAGVDPGAIAVGDPARRTWVLDVAGAPVGWVELRVEGGTGRVGGRARPEHGRDIIRLLGAALAGDLQLARPPADQSTSRGAGAHG